MGYRETYEKNREKLEGYAWWRRGKLAEYDKLEAKAKLYPRGYIGGQRISNPVKIERTNINTKPFFRDLSKPLLVKNEFNGYNIEYVVDNVRRSEDYGGDNHIYFYYDSFDEFLILLQVEDITPYLKDNKIIFLFEEEINDYPIDFKEEYGIDYSKNPPNPIRIDEIKRIFIQWHNHGYSGIAFLAGILDFHKNLLTIKFWGLVGFSYLFDKLLKNKTIDEVYEALLDNENYYIYAEFDAIFCPNSLSWRFAKAPTVENFFSELKKLFPKNYKPQKDEWYKGMFLAYSNALGRDLNQRIAPAIVFHSHHIAFFQDMDVNFDLFDKFKYLRFMSMLRRRTVAIHSVLETFAGGESGKSYDMDFPNGLNLMRYTFSVERYQGTGYKTNLMPLYIDPNFKYLPYMRIIRFEDLKLEPKATLYSLLDYLDIEWDDSLLKTTANGSPEIVSFSSCNKTKDYDLSPVLRKRGKFYSPFDYYRLELVYSDLLAPWGYKPQYYDGKKYSDEEITELFKKPFKCENFVYIHERVKNKEPRKLLMSALKENLHRSPYLSKYNQNLVAIPWLKPKKDFMINNLYE